MITRISDYIHERLGWCPNVQLSQNMPVPPVAAPVPMQSAPSGGRGDAGSDRDSRRRHRGRHMGLIPAGLLIGLGIGLLLGHPVSALFIGLGLGFVATAFVRQAGCTGENGTPAVHSCERRSWCALIGVFFILFGICFVWIPGLLWPYLLAAFLILLGIGILIHSYFHNGRFVDP
ncbi:hypothetical protein Mboo_0953 [Methanoregula boonei 6A8]|uniref:Uncharacterized protein n=1 Tax=Methanoregula boonei (strain DSM 21154 / JCM 14090 / 6A8) TaxID=456442 RepID=A7I6W0_METB6|nr:hypothetical protein [Methanoregula boonei]ABS55471.1 hypothetical protein Mboo_0953 [Methanoregula boonei 6A8]